MQDAAAAEAPGRDRYRPASTGWIAAAHLLALWTFAVAQPILDLIGRQPDFLVAQRLTGAPLAALAVAGALGIPALLALPLLIPGLRSSRAARVWSDGVRALLATAFVLQLLHWLPGAVALVLAAAGGAAAAVCLNRYRVFSNLIVIGAAAALAAPLLFLLRPGVRDLLPTASATSFVPEPPIAEAPMIASDVPIVLVVFDELPTSSLQLPDGSIDERRFPTFSALAGSSDWYVRAVTAGLDTARAIPALLTGTMPRSDTTAYYADHTSNLFSWLADRGGYRIVAQESVSHLCPPAICSQPRPDPLGQLALAADDITVVYGHLLLPPSFRRDLPSIDHSWGGFRADRSHREPDERRVNPGILYQDVPRLVDRFLQQIEERSRPAFYYLHLNLPHRPWKYLPSGLEYTPVGTPVSPTGFDGRYVTSDEQLTVLGLQRHLLQVGYADRVLGQVLAQLKKASVYDRALIVVVADHGVSFRPGQRLRAATEANVEDVLEVPLFVKRPGQTRGAIFDHVVQTIDIAPTIASAVGTRLPWRFDGRELDDRSPREVRACCFAEGDSIQTFEADPVRRQQTLDRLDSLFADGPTGEPFEGVFAAGPRPDLLGRETANLTGTNIDSVGSSPPTANAVLDSPDAYREVRPESGFVPGLVSGRIEPGLANGTPLAISVDGRVRATTRTFTDRGSSRFSALVAERWLPAGSHRIGIHAIHGSSDALPGRDQTVLTSLYDGEHMPQLLVAAGSVHGVELAGERLLERVDHLFQCEIETPGGSFQGRMISRPRTPLLPVDEFFVFDGPDLLYRGQDDRSRRQIRQRGDEREQMIFRISLPAALTDEDSLLLLARSGDQVQQLYPARPEATFELARDSDGRDLLLRRPRSFPDVEPERIAIESAGSRIIGFVDGGLRDDSRIFGWAADRLDLGSHQQIVAFLRGRELWVGRTGIRHSSASERAGHLQSGFGIFDERVSSWNPTPTANDLAAIEREGVVVYAVSRRNLAVRLPFAYRPLERGPDGVEFLPVSDGRRLPVQPPQDGFGGTIDALSKPARRTLIEGWAADVERGERPRQIVIYRDGAFLANLGTSRERPDVAEHYGDPRLLRTGFQGAVPGTSDPETFGETHRVFAIMLRGVAVELPGPVQSDPPR